MTQPQAPPRTLKPTARAADYRPRADTARPLSGRGRPRRSMDARGGSRGRTLDRCKACCAAGNQVLDPVRCIDPALRTGLPWPCPPPQPARSDDRWAHHTIFIGQEGARASVCRREEGHRDEQGTRASLRAGAERGVIRWRRGWAAGTALNVQRSTPAMSALCAPDAGRCCSRAARDSMLSDDGARRRTAMVAGRKWDGTRRQTRRRVRRRPAGTSGRAMEETLTVLVLHLPTACHNRLPAPEESPYNPLCAPSAFLSSAILARPSPSSRRRSVRSRRPRRR